MTSMTKLVVAFAAAAQVLAAGPSTLSIEGPNGAATLVGHNGMLTLTPVGSGCVDRSNWCAPWTDLTCVRDPAATVVGSTRFSGDASINLYSSGDIAFVSPTCVGVEQTVAPAVKEASTKAQLTFGNSGARVRVDVNNKLWIQAPSIEHFHAGGSVAMVPPTQAPTAYPTTAPTSSPSALVCAAGTTDADGDGVCQACKTCGTGDYSTTPLYQGTCSTTSDYTCGGCGSYPDARPEGPGWSSKYVNTAYPGSCQWDCHPGYWASRQNKWCYITSPGFGRDTARTNYYANCGPHGNGNWC
jgi:hypothetical protein